MLCKQTILKSIQASLINLQHSVGELIWVRDMAGGDINQAALIGDGETCWFLKYHPHAPDDMFETESRALLELSSTQSIRVPQPVAYSANWLVLEYMELKSRGPESLLGEQLATLHAHDFGHFGWAQNNYIGTSPQNNSPTGDWGAFWAEQRLLPQLQMAKDRGYSGKLQTLGEKLILNTHQLFGSYQPQSSLLHGDLWAGNKAFSNDGQPVIFDPASYYGDREADLAMTELFGGFSAEFYAAYESLFPLDSGYRVRRDLYNLYHVLNHLNLFGQAYLGRSENMISSLLAEIH